MAVASVIESQTRASTNLFGRPVALLRRPVLHPPYITSPIPPVDSAHIYKHAALYSTSGNKS